VAPDDELQLDRLIHEPARLAVLTVLSSVKDADFTFLQRTTGLTKGNLSSHLAKLETGGLVEITKTFIRKKPNTSVALTPVGRERVARHWEQLERLRQLSEEAAEPADSGRRPRAPRGKGAAGNPGRARATSRPSASTS
jgi:DNA-binding MarR family transcriptional regulator